MTVTLETFVKQLADSGVIAPGKLKDFIPPQAHPKDVQELARQLVQSKHLTAYQAQEIYQGRAKSLILGNYTILDKIGAGGMGQVFKAQHRVMERTVAIKMLPKTMLKDAEAAARFQREVRAAAKLNHANIVTAYDADQAGGVHFLVMEYVEGKDLAVVVKKNGPLPVAKAVNYILQAAKGLEFAHKKGVIHRDIKPSNLLLDKEGVVKILDMGLARLSGDGDAATEAELTSAGTAMGTVDYMAPEQALDTRHADGRADIYSLGITLYYLLAGKSAYSGETNMQKMLAHREQPIPSLKAVQAQVPDKVQAIFNKMVAKKIEDRFQTMSAVVAALESLQAGKSTSTIGNDEATAAMPAAEQEEDLGKSGKTATTINPVASLTMVVAAEKTKHLFAKIVGGSFATIIAPILVAYVIKYMEKNDTPPNLSADGAAADSAASRGAAPPLARAPFNAQQAKAHQAAWVKYLGTTAEEKNIAGMTMVLIPPGEFLMGSTDAQLEAAPKMAEESKAPQDAVSHAQNDERPQHRVVISKPFLISATEVTVGQFKKFVEASKYVTELEQREVNDSNGKAPSGRKKDSQRGLSWKSPGYGVTDESPVSQITWNDACAFCVWLSEQEQRIPWYRNRTHGKRGWLIAAEANGYRLPTEAEWEYACRAGTTTQYSFGDAAAELQRYGWNNKSDKGKAQPVALKLPNPFGLFDMHGNVAEWCQDSYDEKWYEKSPSSDPRCSTSVDARVARGGSWSAASAFGCRSAFRRHHLHGGGNSSLGFRCVRVW